MDGKAIALQRSTKAGASAPATHGSNCRSFPTRGPPPLNEGRSVSPGDTYWSRMRAFRSLTLNEGRSVSPGDTHCSGTSYRQRPALNEGRSVSPGDTAKL